MPADWKPAQPKTADASPAVWAIFGDAQLNDLIAEATRANQSVAQAEANYRAALALVSLARSAYFPTVGASVSESRSSAQTSRGSSAVGDAHSFGLQAAWEPDLWGGVRRSVEAAGASAQSSDATLAAVRLSIQAQVAQDYLQLRINDELQDLLASSVDAYQRALKLSQSQRRAGTVSGSDVALATAQLASTQSLLTDVEATRDVYEHAIAVLLGRPPAGFSIPKQPLQAVLPAIPVGLPSDLLERRPDISVAERLAASANANIGVAKAAYYPVLTLGASAGDSLASFGEFFTAPGPRVVARRDARADAVRRRRATREDRPGDRERTTRPSRSTGRPCWRDSRTSRTISRRCACSRTNRGRTTTPCPPRATPSASRPASTAPGRRPTCRSSPPRTTALSNARIAVQLRGRRYAASVGLIRAIGGGWNATTDLEPALASALEDR